MDRVVGLLLWDKAVLRALLGARRNVCDFWFRYQWRPIGGLCRCGDILPVRKLKFRVARQCACCILTEVVVVGVEDWSKTRSHDLRMDNIGPLVDMDTPDFFGDLIALGHKKFQD